MLHRSWVLIEIKCLQQTRQQYKKKKNDKLIIHHPDCVQSYPITSMNCFGQVRVFNFLIN